MATPEGRIKAMVSKALKELPKTYKFMPVQNGLGASTLDYLLCVGGYFFAIETKKPGGKMTPRQEIVAKEIREAGGEVYVVDSKETLDLAIAHIGLRVKFTVQHV
jgi:hypothetical protein